MSCAVDNNAFEVIITPSRKRKRDSCPIEPSVSTSPKLPAFTNAAFSSTPKKGTKALINRKSLTDKENANHFPVNPCLEVKSISDIVNQKSALELENPYEVVRKPPKKKKKADIEEACFVNPGLNLEVPDKQFNPFEVRRDNPTKFVKTQEPQCFINPALNIRTQEITGARNPFEIQRSTQIEENIANGITNKALDLGSVSVKIGIPFKPTLGCRIDFSNLTPSKLLAEKLVFSPVNPKTPRYLSDISEENSTMDIGKELDRYQLELENSINEAKQRKTIPDGRSFKEKLGDIPEDSQEEEASEKEEPKTPEVYTVKQMLEKKHGMVRLEDFKTPPITTVSDVNIEQKPIGNKSQAFEQIQNNQSFTDDEGIDYDYDDEEEEIDFKAPTPFVRAYRKAESVPEAPVSHHISKESLKSIEFETPTAEHENKSKVKSMIRRSIRKLMHPNKGSNEAKTEKKPLATDEILSTGHHFMDTIRQSLRRKPQKQTVEAKEVLHEVSIVDTSERKMKFKSNLIQTDYIKIEELSTERKPSLRNSIRKSTRDVKKQIMKTVFHKNNEEYAFAK